MKKILLLGVVIVLFTSCEKQEKRYTQQSPEIETYKKVIEAYEKRNWDEMTSHYADTAKIFNNATEKNPQNLAQLVAQNKEDASIFSSWDFTDENAEYEMVVTDKGETWVNFWGLWQGNLKANNKLYEIPAHITARFVDGKIVREYGYWDISKIMMDLRDIETAKITEENTEN
ncbi:hypothetical protein SAMN05428642_103468 [Flaviramulus basaltis]|uniref:SnoaL-like domain-containing protein n=1 Tax=Flaviramulus basaltis TaxID=369401 RepID=A0A1K2IP42_9FLAO|nr:ester cyclase [Flaviramulus basaltis]SFZ93968.1 hypothetical protein SAMN05428642_103468 [Flaviramulus basaltis]